MSYDKHGTWQDSDNHSTKVTPAHVEGEWLDGPKFAKVYGARLAKEVDAYMPNGYKVVGSGVEDGRTFYLIGGYDDAGWTLDGYVEPRLASGLMVCVEVGEHEARIIGGRKLDLPTRPA